MHINDILKSPKLEGIKTRFLEKVDKSGDCWLWTAYRSKDGYGCFRAGNVEGAHRVSFVLHKGPIPDGLFALHKCDNPPCVNPDHLFLGTHADNMADKMKKGRHNYKDLAVLTEEHVLKIRQDSRGQTIIAKEYGVTRRTIDRVILRQTWSHI